MAVTFSYGLDEQVEIPEPTSEQEHQALQVVIEAARNVDTLPEDSPMAAALRDLSFTLQAHRSDTTPHMARCFEVLADAFARVEDELNENGHQFTDQNKENLYLWYARALRGEEFNPAEIAEQRGELRLRFKQAEPVMDAADKALAATRGED